MRFAFFSPENIPRIAVNECFTPPITALRQNFERIAETAAERMFQAVVNGIPPIGAVIPFQLIERKSVRDPEPK